MFSFRLNRQPRGSLARDCQASRRLWYVRAENNAGSGGLVSTAPTTARFISHHAVWGLGGRTVGTRHGSFDGTTSGARSRPDDIDFAYVFNRRVTDDEHNGITKAIDAYLDAHPV